MSTYRAAVDAVKRIRAGCDCDCDPGVELVCAHCEAATAIPALEAMAARVEELERDAGDIRAVFMHGADDSGWLPGNTVAEAVADLRARLAASEQRVAALEKALERLGSGVDMARREAGDWRLGATADAELGARRCYARAALAAAQQGEGK